MLENRKTYSDFVISSAGDNKNLAAWIAGLIEMQGRTITVQGEHYRHQDFLHLIKRAMQAQTRVVALLSEAFFKDEACLKEVAEAIRDDPLNKKRRLILFRIDNCQAKGLLANIPFTDLAPVLQQQDARKVAETVLRALGSSKPRFNFIPPLPKGAHLLKTTILHPLVHENRLFTGRKELLARLAAKLQQVDEPVVLSNSQQLAQGDSGMAGVGKSLLAREYGWQNRNSYQGVWWLPAHSRGTIIQALTELGERLTPPILAIESREAAAKMVIEALETRKFAKPWLLIYDDVETSRVLEQLVPRTGAHVLLTSRWTDLYSYSNKLEVEVFSRELAVWYLCNLAGESDPETASRISAALGNHPLSLSLVGNYCRTERVSLGTYFQRFNEELRKRPRQREKQWKYSDSLYVVFDLSLKRVLEGRTNGGAKPSSPLAGIVMGVTAFFAPDNIPLDLFQVPLPSFPGTLSASATACPHSSRHFERHASRSIALSDGEDADGSIVFSIDADELSKIVTTLVNYGLLTHVEMQGGQPGLATHWLVQEMMQAKLKQQGQFEAMAGLATGLLAEAFPNGDGDQNNPGNSASWTRCAQLLPHVMAMVDHIPENGELASPSSQRQKAGMGGREVAILLNQAGLYLKARGDLGEAESQLQLALAINRLTYGADHEKVAVSLNNLAVALQDKKRLEEAERLFLEAARIDENRFGGNHPNVARDLFNIGLLYQAMGREAEVEPLLHRALQINVKNFGRSHANVAIVLNSLGRLYEATNQIADAVPLYRRALEIDEITYGDKHPYVARDQESLARLLKLLGQGEEAEALLRRVLELDERNLGPDHPDVATNLGNLAALIEETRGNYKEAEKLKLRALAIDESCFGPNHPNVARDLNNLATLLKTTGRKREAEQLMRRVIAIFEKTLGAEHQNVATILNNLADLLRETKRFDEAESLYRRALKIDQKNFGLDHHAVARDYNNLALLLKITGRLREAEPFAKRALVILENNLQADHPWVQRARSNLDAIETDLGSTRDREEPQPSVEVDLAVLGEQTNRSDGDSLWDLFDEEAATRNTEPSPSKAKILDKLLRNAE